MSRALMMISSNPTRTKTIEKNWNREITKRWAAFEASASKRLELMLSGVILNKEGFFPLDASQQRVYMVFLQTEINKILLGGDNWQIKHQALAYQRGIDATRASLISQGAGIIPTESERIAAQSYMTFTATPSMGAGFGAPIHQEALEFLSTRSYTSLKGWTDKMANDLRQVLFDGVEQGQGVEEISRNIVAKIHTTRSRARLIARTETNQAYALSSISEAKRASDEIDEEIQLRWLTKRDSNVRHLHATWHGKLMTPEQASRNKTVSPWNCRCGLAPVIKEADTKVKRAKFAEERKQLLAAEAA